MKFFWIRVFPLQNRTDFWGLPAAFILDREGMVRERVPGRAEIQYPGNCWRFYCDEMKRVDDEKELNL